MLHDDSQMVALSKEIGSRSHEALHEFHAVSAALNKSSVSVSEFPIKREHFMPLTLVKIGSSYSNILVS